MSTCFIVINLFELPVIFFAREYVVYDRIKSAVRWRWCKEFEEHCNRRNLTYHISLQLLIQHWVRCCCSWNKGIVSRCCWSNDSRWTMAKYMHLIMSFVYTPFAHKPWSCQSQEILVQAWEFNYIKQFYRCHFNLFAPPPLATPLLSTHWITFQKTVKRKLPPMGFGTKLPKTIVLLGFTFSSKEVKMASIG